MSFILIVELNEEPNLEEQAVTTVGSLRFTNT